MLPCIPSLLCLPLVVTINKWWVVPHNVNYAFHIFLRPNFFTSPVKVQASVNVCSDAFKSFSLRFDVAALDSIFGARAFAVFHWQKVILPSHSYVVATDDILFSATTHHDHGMHLQVVTNARNVGLHNAAIGKPDVGNLTTPGVGLPRRCDVDLGAHSLPGANALQPLLSAIERPLGNHLWSPLVEEPASEVLR